MLTLSPHKAHLAQPLRVDEISWSGRARGGHECSFSAQKASASEGFGRKGQREIPGLLDLMTAMDLAIRWVLTYDFF